MFRCRPCLRIQKGRLLRTSGDVSKKGRMWIISHEFAPHERRCFCLDSATAVDFDVCSARAEMFPKQCRMELTSLSLLRTSGDVSIKAQFNVYAYEFAPHERRCFSRGRW